MRRLVSIGAAVLAAAGILGVGVHDLAVQSEDAARASQVATLEAAKARVVGEETSLDGQLATERSQNRLLQSRVTSLDGQVVGLRAQVGQLGTSAGTACLARLPASDLDYNYSKVHALVVAWVRQARSGDTSAILQAADLGRADDAIEGDLSTLSEDLNSGC